MLEVVGLESGDLFLRDNERLIHAGDNLSIVDVRAVGTTSSDIDVCVRSTGVAGRSSSGAV